jgi:hypothetical protein
MSQFLWVEDFGDVDIDATTSSVLGGILKHQNIPDNKFRLKEFLANHGVLLKLDFVDALKFIRNPEELLRIDYIILDIWLPVDITKSMSTETGEKLQILLQRYHEDKQTACKELEKMAGYQLYVELIMEIGFPKEHILFCSNHAEELSSIGKAFGEAKLQLPDIRTKQREEDIAFVQNWVKLCRKDPYSVLRRGILNVLDDIIEGNANFNLTEPFKKDVPVNKDSFLDGLRFMLSSPRVPSEDKRQHLYRILCDYLTKYFDRFSPKNLYKGDRIQKADFIPAYFIRNWVAHNIIKNSNSEFSERDIGFLFILVMKAMFDYSNGNDKFKLLYDYPTSINNTELKNCLISLHTDCRNHSIVPKYETEIFELIRLRGEQNKNRQQIPTEDFVALMYASFLFSCVRIEPKTKTTNIELKYEINWNYMIDYQEDVLFAFLKSIAYHRLKDKNYLEQTQAAKKN